MGTGASIDRNWWPGRALTRVAGLCRCDWRQHLALHQGRPQLAGRGADPRRHGGRSHARTSAWRWVGAHRVLHLPAPAGLLSHNWRAGNFAVWGGLFSCFDCTYAAVRKKEDPWNAIMAGASTGGVLAARGACALRLAPSFQRPNSLAVLWPGSWGQGDRA